MISPNLRIAYRFLTAKKRAMFMSLSCTVLGVGLFIVTQATTSGFELFFTKTLLGIHVRTLHRKLREQAIEAATKAGYQDAAEPSERVLAGV